MIFIFNCLHCLCSYKLCLHGYIFIKFIWTKKRILLQKGRLHNEQNSQTFILKKCFKIIFWNYEHHFTTNEN